MLVTYVYNPNPKNSEMKNLNLFVLHNYPYCSKWADFFIILKGQLLNGVFRPLLSIFDAPNIVKQPFTNLVRPMK